MGWGDCGEDSKGRPIGYLFPAICDAPGCAAAIHRGLAYACGGMHGALEWACEGYFCEKHRGNCLPIDGDTQAVCDACYAEARRRAIDQPDDSSELIAHFEEWEGEDWRETAA
jgi:hypothetical protein